MHLPDPENEERRPGRDGASKTQIITFNGKQDSVGLEHRQARRHLVRLPVALAIAAAIFGQAADR
jgi:hypothetical protein